MKKILIKILGFVAAILPALSYAHPGHGDKNIDGYSAMHYLTEPGHLIVFGLAISSVVVLWYFLVRKRVTSNKKP